MKSPFGDDIANISPTDFEKGVKTILDSFEKELKNLKVMHDVQRVGVDGSYQIDVSATFEAFGGAEFVLLVECKRYNHPIKRELVQLLKDKVQSTGAHKGMLCSTSKFQSGAIKYAKTHGIALVRIVADDSFHYDVRYMDGFELNYVVNEALPDEFERKHEWYFLKEAEEKRTVFGSFRPNNPKLLEKQLIGDS